MVGEMQMTGFALNRWLRCKASVLLAGYAMVSLPAYAADPIKDYPVRPVRIVSGFPAGGSSDFLARVLAPKFSERMGQNFIVENRPGAGGAIGAQYVAKATPDGHTLLFISGAFVAHAATVKTPYDPLKDFDWISTIVTYPMVLVVRNDFSARNVAELIALAKKNPGKLNYGSVGVGSVFHLGAELFNSLAGTDMLHIPYKGSTEPLTEMIGGRLDLMLMTLTGATPHIRANRIRALAVSSKERAPQMPELPPIAETVPGYEVISFAGLGATGGSPAPIIAKLNRELRAVVVLPDVSRQFSEAGGNIRPSSPQEMTRHVTEEIAKWRRLMKERGIDVK
jgi:tripartite-type tricarboxylate transporter receptor subunit TctC